MMPKMEKVDAALLEVAAALQDAVYVLVHREITAHGSVRLSEADIEAYVKSMTMGVGVRMDYDEETGEIVLTHRSAGQA